MRFEFKTIEAARRNQNEKELHKRVLKERFGGLADNFAVAKKKNHAENLNYCFATLREGDDIANWFSNESVGLTEQDVWLREV